MDAMAQDPGADPAEVEVRDNPEMTRYEATAGDRLAGTAVYETRPGALVFTHTVVMPRWEGRGVGGRLARAALDDVRARGLRAIPRCPFIAAWIRRHPDYEDLVPPEDRGLLDRRS
jgi:uncharacterized protein